MNPRKRNYKIIVIIAVISIIISCGYLTLKFTIEHMGDKERYVFPSPDGSYDLIIHEMDYFNVSYTEVYYRGRQWWNFLSLIHIGGNTSEYGMDIVSDGCCEIQWDEDFVIINYPGPNHTERTEKLALPGTLEQIPWIPLVTVAAAVLFALHGKKDKQLETE